MSSEAIHVGDLVRVVRAHCKGAQRRIDVIGKVTSLEFGTLYCSYCMHTISDSIGFAHIPLHGGSGLNWPVCELKKIPPLEEPEDVTLALWKPEPKKIVVPGMDELERMIKELDGGLK